MNHVEATSLEILPISIATHVHSLTRDACSGSGITYDADALRLGVELGRANLDLALGCRVRTWVVSEVD